MSITRLQQARQMYATGQRVGRVAFQGGGASWSPSSPSNKTHSKSYNPGAGGVVDHTPQNTGPDRSHVSDLQTYNTKKAIGRLGRQDANQEDSTIFYGTPTKTNPSGMIDIGYQGPLNEREQAFQNFVDYRKPVQTFGLSGLFKKPLQSFSDFNASINRPYFEKVVRAGKFNYKTKDGKPLGFDMTQDEYEDAYQNYMSQRHAGNIDAYGNPIGGGGNDGGGGIMDIYNTVNDTDTDTGTETDDFVWRFAGNQPEDVVERIEEQYKDYYTV